MFFSDSSAKFNCKCKGLKEINSPVVVSRGNPSSDLMLIGEAPGAMEEKLSLPFVGRSGEVLNRLLNMAGFDDEKDVYICNLVKTRPPNNRVPTMKEISLHLPWLYQQIKLVNPLIIILIGSTAMRVILNLKSKISLARGTWHNWYGINVMPIFHPAYLLRNPSKDSGKPYDLTCSDFYEISRKLNELRSFRKRPSIFIPMVTSL